MKKTQADRVLQYIHDFGNISTFDAFTDLGVTRLSARIFELRKRFDIKNRVQDIKKPLWRKCNLCCI